MIVLLSRLKKNSLLVSLILNGVFFALYLCLGEWRFGSLDDFFMSSVLVGAYGGQYDVHMYFVNAVYGFVLKPLYMLFPTVGWYSVGESLEVFASFVAITYCILITLKNVYGRIISLLLLVCVLPAFWPDIGFTQCSAVLTAAGIILASCSVLQNKRKLMVLAVVFFCGGYVMRSQMFLLGLPTLLAALCICFYKTKRVCKIQLTILCVGLISVVCLHFFDSSMYKDGGYDYYAAYQGPRSFFGDGGFYDMESAYDELKERGMCAADLRVLRSWYYYDKDAFALDSLNKIIDVVSRSNYEINYLKMPLAVMIAMSHAFVGSNVWCWLLLCFVYIFYSKYGFRYLPWLSLGIVAISYFYLLLVNRVVAHVEVGGWLYACVLLIPFIGSDNVVYSKIKSLFPCLSVLCILGCVVARSFYVMPDVLSKGFVITQKQSSMWIEFERYALNHPNDVFLLPFDVYKMYAEYYAMPHESIKPNSWNNIVSLGYWNINLPSMENELQKRGVANPMLDILRENVYVLEERTPVLPNYFKEHYNKVLFADTITNFGDAFLLRYRLEGNNEKFR